MAWMDNINESQRRILGSFCKWMVVIFAVFCVVMLLAYAAPVQQSMNISIPITCNDQSQCVAVIGTTPFLFTGNSSNTTILYPFNYSYDAMMFQNITVNVTTQVVNVTYCNNTPNINLSTNDIANQISGQLGPSITNSCRDACKVEDAERSTLTLGIAMCNTEKNNTIIQCEADKQSIRATYDRDLNISRQETQTAQDELIPWIILTGFFFSVGAVYAFVQWRLTRPQKIPTGSSTTLDGQEPEENPLDDKPGREQ